MKESVLLYRHEDPAGLHSVMEIVIPADRPDMVECLVYEGRDECVGVFLGSPDTWRDECLRMAHELGWRA